MLSIQQALGDRGTQTGHRNALFFPCTDGRQGRCRGSGSRCFCRFCRLVLQKVNHVLFGHTATFASPRNRLRIDAVFLCQHTGSRINKGILGGSGGRRFSGGGRRCCSRGGGATHFKLTDQLAGLDDIAFVFNDAFDDTVGSGQYFENRFVGFNIDNQLVPGNRFPRLLMPSSDGAFFDRFGKLRRINICHSNSLNPLTFDRVSDQLLLLFSMSGHVSRGRRCTGVAACITQEQARLVRPQGS